MTDENRKEVDKQTVTAFHAKMNPS